MASTAVASPTSQSKKGIKWNNVFGPGHRRSRSLTGLNKANAADALRSTQSLGLSSAREADALTLTPADHAQAIVEEGEEEISTSTSVSPKSSVALSPPPRPKPAPRLWTAPSFTENTLPGLETAIAPNSLSVQTMQASTSPKIGSASGFVGSDARTLVSRFSSRSNERSLSKRRKGSVVDLDLESNTIKPRVLPETIPDSPTLTGQTPRSSKRTPKGLAGSRDCPTPRAVASDPQLSETRQEMEPALKTPQWEERSQRRASSMLLPFNLAPLVVPSMPPRTPPIPPLETIKKDPQLGFKPISGPGSGRKRVAGTNEQPPKVPPKSPRTLMRAFPTRPSVTSSGTPSTSHTANSSISSISPIETPITALTNMTWSPMAQIPSPGLLSTQDESSPLQSDPPFAPVRSDSLRASNKSIPESTLDRNSEDPLPPPTLANPAPSSIKHMRSTSSLASSKSGRLSSSPAPTQGMHLRMTSESSVMNRGRPMRRGDVSLQRSISRGLKMAFINGSFTELPKGLKKSQVSGALATEEVRGLRRDAEEQVSRYEILTQLQIANLNQEVRLLDENCEQIRQTIVGLREGRKAILLSMRLYLNAPGSALSLREQIMKQETALSEIDESVDEWTVKLDAAMSRKQMIQGKLSEHVAAILAIPNSLGDSGRMSEEQTPPRSPERKVAETAVEEIAEEYPSVEREQREVESIRIYADSGVASLLRSIEQEIDMMDQSRRHGQ